MIPLARWGKTANGHQRWRCRSCRRKIVRRADWSCHPPAWFRRWLHGTTVRNLKGVTKRSPRTLRRRLIRLLRQAPGPDPRPNPACHMMIDATYFEDGCLLTYWDTDRRWLQWWRWTTAEYREEIAADLDCLQRHGVVLASVTSDGHPSILSAVASRYPGILHQRCLVHIERQARIWLTQRPKTEAGRALRRIVRLLLRIREPIHREWWLDTFVAWCDRWEPFLKERSWNPDRRGWWFTHRSLRRVRTLLQRALPDLFHFLDDPTILKDTNGLEGRFGSMKQHYRQHRGLRAGDREAYLRWYLTIVINREKPPQNGH